MTLVVAFASRASGAGRPGPSSTIWVMADSRLSLETGPFDAYIKAQTLGTRSAVVAAGHSTLAHVAVEGARPFIAHAQAARARAGLGPLSVLVEANLIWRHLDIIFGQFQEVIPDASVGLAIAGWFSDGTPGIVQVEYSRDERQLLVFRPRSGERTHAVLGTPYWKPIMSEALRRSRPPDGQSFHDVISVLWDIARHEGIPAIKIGGSVAFGHCHSEHDLFQWPLLNIEGTTFLHGLEFPPMAGAPDPLRLEYNPDLLPTLERESAENQFAIGENPDARICVRDDGWAGDLRLLTQGLDDEWLLSELDGPANPLGNLFAPDV